MAKKNINIDWDSTTKKLENGEITKIEQFASQYGISRPTAKKLLSEHYGTQIIFNRGRAGGIVFGPVRSVCANNP